MCEIVVVEQLVLARAINVDAGQDLLHVIQELIREIFAPRPFGQAQFLLLANCALSTLSQQVLGSVSCQKTSVEGM
jgi:hypothetical protein